LQKITLHFDGPIAVDHQMLLRSHSIVLAGMQSAIDRAVIDISRGDLRKYARLRQEDYAETEFLVTRSRDGGVIFDLVRQGTQAVTSRLIDALKPAYERAIDEAQPIVHNLLEQVAARSEALANGAQQPISRSELSSFHSSVASMRKYADRSINKEFDQVFGLLRSSRFQGSTLEMKLSAPKNSVDIAIDSAVAARFHSVVSARSIGDPVKLTVTVRAMDAGRGNLRPTGKLTHLGTNTDFVLHFKSPDDFNLLAPYVKAGQRSAVEIIAAPILEYGTFDPVAGDMYFLSLG
jgi:hypothetical protein